MKPFTPTLIPFKENSMDSPMTKVSYRRRTPLQQELFDLYLEIGTVLPDKIMEHVNEFYGDGKAATQEAVEPLKRVRAILVEATANILEVTEESVLAELTEIRNFDEDGDSDDEIIDLSDLDQE